MRRVRVYTYFVRINQKNKVKIFCIQLLFFIGLIVINRLKSIKKGAIILTAPHTKQFLL